MGKIGRQIFICYGAKKMNYIIYDKNGNILRTGSCPKNALHLIADPMAEEYVIEGTANDMEDCIDDFNVVKRQIPLKYPEPSCSQKRQRAYPAMGNYIDAQVKIQSGDIKMAEEGQLQLSEYIKKCLAVKKQFPKS